MNTLEKLHAIEAAPGRCIYDIHYCKAGVGFQWYEFDRDTKGSWRDGLVTWHYYPTFEAAVDAEYARLVGSRVIDG